MMELETALPTAETAEASEQVNADQLAHAEGEGSKDEPKEPKQLTPEERELRRIRRGIDRRTAQLEEDRAEAAQARAEAEQLRQQLGLTHKRQESNNSNQSEDGETLSLSRADLQKLIDDRAKELAPTIKQQADEIEHRRSIVGKLAKEWGADKFDELASDLDDAFGGLADRTGKPKAATDAIFESDSPKALIEYLADPDHAEEASALARMTASQAGRAVAKLEAKLAAEKLQPSKAAAPIEAVRGGGSTKTAPDASDAGYIDWKIKQINGR